MLDVEDGRRRSAGPRPGARRRTQRGTTSRADHDLPARVRRRGRGRQPGRDRAAGRPGDRARRALGQARGRARPETSRTRSRQGRHSGERTWTTVRGASRRPRVGGMRAVIVPEPGGPDALVVADLPDPERRTRRGGDRHRGLRGQQGRHCCSGRASTRPRRARPTCSAWSAPAPISAVGAASTRWSVGDEVCALLASGGYADKVAVPAGQVMPVPAGVDLVTASALPEVAATVWSNVFMIASLRPGETFLVHGGAGGIGTHGDPARTRSGGHRCGDGRFGGQARDLPVTRGRHHRELPRGRLRGRAPGGRGQRT